MTNIIESELRGIWKYMGREIGGLKQALESESEKEKRITKMMRKLN